MKAVSREAWEAQWVLSWGIGDMGHMCLSVAAVT